MHHKNELGGDGTTCDLIQPAKDGAEAVAESLQITATYSGAGGDCRMEIGMVDVGSGKTMALEPEIVESLENAFAGLLDRVAGSGAGTFKLNLGTGLLEHRPADGVAELYDLESGEAINSDPREELGAGDAERLDAAADPDPAASDKETVWSGSGYFVVARRNCYDERFAVNRVSVRDPQGSHLDLLARGRGGQLTSWDTNFRRLRGA